ncbi:ester cyclase [Undibacterium pigrum]|uniref:Putative ester cyclase n=1 Tax=Undibacterium pigrum TaxID=401470 RepID=A0A318J240_9BURK|nr:ester cyclase [Undibacterium pigrum]PXX41464.1 putative ester cyclase [Undibacterium pigrum]
MTATNPAEQNLQHQELVRRLYEDCFNTGKLELVPEIIATDFSSNRGEHGHAEFTANIAGLRKAFPDVHFVIEDIFGAMDRVAVRWSFNATHSAPFAGTAATGKAVTQQGNVIYQIKHNKIAQAWVQIDRLGLMQQLGAL